MTDQPVLKSIVIDFYKNLYCEELCYHLFLLFVMSFLGVTLIV